MYKNDVYNLSFDPLVESRYIRPPYTKQGNTANHHEGIRPCDVHTLTFSESSSLRTPSDEKENYCGSMIIITPQII